MQKRASDNRPAMTQKRAEKEALCCTISRLQDVYWRVGMSRDSRRKIAWELEGFQEQLRELEKK